MRCPYCPGYLDAWSHLGEAEGVWPGCRSVTEGFATHAIPGLSLLCALSFLFPWLCLRSAKVDSLTPINSSFVKQPWSRCLVRAMEKEPRGVAGVERLVGELIYNNTLYITIYNAYNNIIYYNI